MKKTDYKKMYKKIKKENTKLFNENSALSGHIKSQAQLIRDLSSGKIKGEKK